MEMHEAEVAYRIDERRKLAEALRLDRRRPGRRPFLAVRSAIGRRLIELGAALLDDAAPGPVASR